jgi:hypothetical protein
MGVINIRELLDFPKGDNKSDTFINEVHYNLTTLNEFNYTLYSNNTISNGSNCYLIFDQFKPIMASNGTWSNSSSCYIPYYGIGNRGAAGAGLGALFGLSIILSMINLRKHGRQFLREDKRFRLVGRRWQWYWMLFAAACGMISTLTGIDVDRYYLQSTPIILQSLFYSLMLPAILAAVWEASRHWYDTRLNAHLSEKFVKLTIAGVHGKSDNLSIQILSCFDMTINGAKSSSICP